MTVCVDSSLAIKWILPENDSDDARRLLADWRASGEAVIAPSHFYVEVTSVLRQRTVRGGADHMELADAHEALVRLLMVNVAVHALPHLHGRVLDLAAELSQPTTYDTHYLALADAEGCEFWTADERLYRAARRRFPWVRWLGEDRG